jgi:hypothetical protein
MSLAAAARVLAEAPGSLPEPMGLPSVSADFEHLRWFPFPDEARAISSQ